MPYKRGPNNTLRYYSKKSGKYCKDPQFNITPIKQKLSGKEKEQLRRENIFQQAQRSKDKNLFLVFSFLEGIDPGCVKHVNCFYCSNKTSKIREFDIITSRSIYEVKSGFARHKTKQYLAQIEVAKDLNKDHVVYSPGSTDYQVKCMRAEGIKIFNKFDEFKDYERNKNARFNHFNR